jgi:hypothetical protein
MSGKANWYTQLKNQPQGIRLMLVDRKNNFFFYNNQTGVYSPYKHRIYQMTCTQGHKTPEDGCVCGLQFTVNKKWIMNMVNNYEKVLKFDPHAWTMMPLITTWDMCGTTNLDERTGAVRTQRAYMRNIIIPIIVYQRETQDWKFVYNLMKSDIPYSLGEIIFHDVLFPDFAWDHIVYSWRGANIDLNCGVN